MITGASRGIGAAVARQLGERGYRVVAINRNPAEGFESIRGDLSSMSEVRRVADELGLLDENARRDAIVESDAEANAKSETRDETTRENERLERMNDSRRDDSRRVNDSRE